MDAQRQADEEQRAARREAAGMKKPGLRPQPKNVCYTTSASQGIDPMLAARLARARQTNRDSGKEQLVQDGASLRKSIQYLSEMNRDLPSRPVEVSRVAAASGAAPSSDPVPAVVPLAEVGSQELAALAHHVQPRPQISPQQLQQLQQSAEAAVVQHGGVEQLNQRVDRDSHVTCKPTISNVRSAPSLQTVHVEGATGVGSIGVERSAAEAAVADELTRVLRPPTKGTTVECLIRRERKGLDRFWPVYRMYVQRDDGDEFVLAARRRKQADGHSFLISRASGDLKKGSNYIAKLRSNFLGTDWMLYDSGSNPAKLPKADAGAGVVRRELGLFNSQQNVVGSAAPRRVRVMLPSLDETGFPAVRRPTTESASLPALARNDQTSAKDYLFFTNREPRLNPATGRYSLNFNGRVTMGSVKNMQLVETSRPDAVVCQFGKVGKDEFTCDFTWPLTPLQAFGLGVSSLAYKLANEGG